MIINTASIRTAATLVLALLAGTACSSDDIAVPAAITDAVPVTAAPDVTIEETSPAASTEPAPITEPDATNASESSLALTADLMAATLTPLLSQLGLDVTPEQSECLATGLFEEFGADGIASLSGGGTPEQQQILIGVFTECDVNLAAATPPTGPLDASTATVAVLRSLIVEQGATSDQATCVIDELTDELGEAGIADAMENPTEELDQLLIDIGNGCGLPSDFFS